MGEISSFAGTYMYSVNAHARIQAMISSLAKEYLSAFSN